VNTVKTDVCRPGDITLTPVHGGFLIGRVLPDKGPGPWWDLIKVVLNREAAIEDGRRLLVPGRTRMWFHEGGDLSRAVPIDFSEGTD
jgi:hypothetical protein